MRTVNIDFLTRMRIFAALIKQSATLLRAELSLAIMQFAGFELFAAFLTCYSFYFVGREAFLRTESTIGFELVRRGRKRGMTVFANPELLTRNPTCPITERFAFKLDVFAAGFTWMGAVVRGPATYSGFATALSALFRPLLSNDARFGHK